MHPHWYGTFVEGIEQGEPAVRRCTSCGAVQLPPRTICQKCGVKHLESTTISLDANVLVSTEITVAPPAFSADVPYVIVIAQGDNGIRLTGQLRGAEAVDPGTDVTLGVEPQKDDARVLTFTPK